MSVSSPRPKRYRQRHVREDLWHHERRRCPPRCGGRRRCAGVRLRSIAAQVSPLRVADIVKRLPPRCSPSACSETRRRTGRPDRHQAGLQAAQLHGSETPEMVREVKQDVRVVFKAVVAGTERVRECGRRSAPTPSWSTRRHLGRARCSIGAWPRMRHPSVAIIMAGGLERGNVADAIDKVRPWGVDVSTGVERRPGVKDPILVRDFVRIAKSSAPAEFESSSPRWTSHTTGRRTPHGDDRPDARRTFGRFGGRFVPETLIPACEELETRFARRGPTRVPSELDGCSATMRAGPRR